MDEGTARLWWENVNRLVHEIDVNRRRNLVRSTSDAVVCLDEVSHPQASKEGTKSDRASETPEQCVARSHMSTS